MTFTLVENNTYLHFLRFQKNTLKGEEIMLKKISLKIGICLTFALLMMVAFKSTNAYAADTKYVTVSHHWEFTEHSSELGEIMSYIAPSTENYDDGVYSGTLDYSGTANWSETLVCQDGNDPVYAYSFDTVYSGTVTRYVTETSKSITVYQHWDITEHSSEINDIINSLSQSPYYYNDGNYSGYLNYSGTANWRQTLVAQDGNDPVYAYSFDLVYTGTVTTD